MSTTPHDALFKVVFGEPENARGQLQAVVPFELAAAIDWPTLARRQGSFIDEALVERHTDLLFSVQWRTGSDALVYILFEHQSTPDPFMAFRLLRYLVRIWERWWTEHPDATQLPAIVPVVLYHGATKWWVPRTLQALLDVPDGVRPGAAAHLIEFAYLLDDLSDTSDDELRARAATALAKLASVCFKHARTESDLVEMLRSWKDVLRDVFHAKNGLQALEHVVRYLLLTNDGIDRDALRALLATEVDPRAKDIPMTVGERLVEQGRQEGRQEGLQDGKRELLLELQRQRFGGDVNAETALRIATATESQIRTWATRMLSAPSLSDVLAA